MPNLPPQTGIIDFLRRLDDANDPSFLQQFEDDPHKLMTMCGLTEDHKKAILSGDNDQIAKAVGYEYFHPTGYDFVRFANAYSKKWHLNYRFPDPPPPHATFTPQDLVVQLQKDVQRLNQLVAQLAFSLQ